MKINYNVKKLYDVKELVEYIENNGYGIPVKTVDTGNKLYRFYENVEKNKIVAINNTHHLVIREGTILTRHSRQDIYYNKTPFENYSHLI